MVEQFAQSLVRHRWVYFVLGWLFILLSAWGMGRLGFESGYRIFFSAENPQLQAHDFIEATYNKSDNLAFVIEPADGEVFSRATLASIEQLTEQAWQLPYSRRVDSITNYQHTEAEGDDLLVANLVEFAEDLSDAELQRVRTIALNEPLLKNFLVAADGAATMVNIEMQTPDDKVSEQNANGEIVAAARELKAQIEADNPNLTLHMIGNVIVNNTFNELAKRDVSELILKIVLPLMIVLLWLLTRSIPGTLMTTLVIITSVLATLGIAGWLGFKLNQVNVTTPIIILTLAVCDCVHVLNTYFHSLGEMKDRSKAMVESMRVNLQPVFLTSITTAIGFASMNFSDSPPFQDLGTIAAIGVMVAMVLTFALVPAVMLLFPAREKHLQPQSTRLTDAISHTVVKRETPVFWGTLLVSLCIIAFIARNELNDNTIGYFKEGVPFRTAADFLQENLTGFDLISYSIDSGESQGINDPAFQQKVAEFADWYLSQPEVVHVSSYTDIMKRLNKNLHGDDPDWYKLPDDRELASQYLLLYELSLPFGLDLTNQINQDKSAVKITVRIKDQRAKEVIAIEQRAKQWLADNMPEYEAKAASISLMFAYVGQRNIDSMIEGSIVALILVSLTLIISLRSLRYGLLSLIPNAFPAAIAFGIWGFFVGEVNLAVAVIFAITLGIVVDDTVHFITKYLRARYELKRPPEEAVHYAFKVVGRALITTSIVLAVGFFAMSFSDFNVNATMGLMVSLTIVIALVFDFLFLPLVLLKVDRRREAAVSA